MKQGKYKQKLLCLLIAISTIIISSCTRTGNAPGAIQGGIEAAPYFKTLLVIGDDRSGSTSDIRKLKEEDYQALFTAVSEKGGGTVAVCLIGNPHSQNKEPYLLKLELLQNTVPYDPRDTHLTLTEKSRVKLKNDKINESNKKALEDNQEKINQYISTVIKNTIIAYKPNGVDHTDLDDAIFRLNTLIHEPGYKDYNNIVVVMLSDGKNQPVKAVKPITAILSHLGAKVYLVGWNTGTNCFQTAGLEKFSVKDGMIEVVKNLK